MNVSFVASAMLAICASAGGQGSAPVGLAIPWEERLPHDDQTIPIPSAASGNSCAFVGDRLLLAWNPNPPFSPGSVIEYRRNDAGAWYEVGPLPAEVLPAEANGIGGLRRVNDQIVELNYKLETAPNTYTNYYALLRAVPSGWVRLPDAWGVADVDGELRSLSLASSQVTIRRFVDGAWVVAATHAASEFGLSSILGTDVRWRVGGTFASVSGPAIASEWGVVAGATRTVVVDLRHPDRPPIKVPTAANVVRSADAVAGGSLLWLVDSSTGVRGATNRVLELSAEGELLERTKWVSLSTWDVPRAMTAAGSLVGNGWVSARRSAGEWSTPLWVRGNASSLVIDGTDGDIATVETDGTGGWLRIWRSPWDLDANGRRDDEDIRTGAVTDCNRNGVPDAADIGRGILADADGNGVPDACAEDCDANGRSDLGQLRDGEPATCSGSLRLATCAIADGAADLDQDGTPDECQPDRNRNGIPDFVEVAAGAPDCDGNGIPNGTPSFGISGESLADPGSILFYYIAGSWTAASGQFGMVAGYFPIDAPTRIDAVRFRVNPGPDPTSTNAPVGRPFNVLVLQSLSVSQPVSASRIAWSGAGVYGSGEVNGVSTPPIVLQPPGFVVCYTFPSGVFGIVSGSGPTAGIRAVPTDGAGRGDPLKDRGWFGYGDAQLPAASGLSNLSYAGFFPDIEVISDGCAPSGDLDGDGTVGGRDLGILLGAWGPANGSPCDLNNDGSVDGVDLAILLGNFTSGS
jgi:hypothetical protein